LARSHVALLDHGLLADEGRCTGLLFIATTEHRQKVLHGFWLTIVNIIIVVVLLLDSLDLYLAQLDLPQFTLLLLRLLDDDFEIAFANLPISELFVDPVLVITFSQLACLLIELLLLVVPLLDQVLVDRIDCVWRQFLLLLCRCLRQIINNFFISILELARLIDLRVQVRDDLALDVVRHD